MRKHLSSVSWRAFSLSSRVRKPLERLLFFRSLGEVAQRDHLLHSLKDVLHRHSSLQGAPPEWTRALRQSNPLDFFKAWREIPVLTKTDLQSKFNPNALRRQGRTGVEFSTGGSTGEPTRFLHDEGMLRAKSAARLYARLQQGWNPGVRTVGVWGSERDIGKSRSLTARAVSYVRNEALVDGYKLDEGTLERLIAASNDSKEIAVFGFSTMLDYLARTALTKKDLRLRGRVATAWNGGESLTAEHVSRFKDAFGVPILNLYGGREFSAIAFQSKESGPLETMLPLLFVEVLDESGAPVPAGQAGQVVITSTVCNSTPFVRYAIGDMAKPSSVDRITGAAISLASIEGRRGESIPLPSGKVLHPLVWNHLMKEYESVLAFQVRVGNGFRILITGDVSSDDLQSINAAASRLLESPGVSVELVPTIPRTAQGKLLQVIKV